MNKDLTMNLYDLGTLVINGIQGYSDIARDKAQRERARDEATRPPARPNRAMVGFCVLVAAVGIAAVVLLPRA